MLRSSLPSSTLMPMSHHLCCEYEQFVVHLHRWCKWNAEQIKISNGDWKHIRTRQKDADRWNRIKLMDDIESCCLCLVAQDEELNLTVSHLWSDSLWFEEYKRWPHQESDSNEFQLIMQWRQISITERQRWRSYETDSGSAPYYRKKDVDVHIIVLLTVGS